MKGLEAVLFAVFIIFVLINLLIRFVVRRSRRQRKEGGSAPAEAEDAVSEYEEAVKPEEGPLIPSVVREAFDAEWAFPRTALETGEETTLEIQAETGAPAEQRISIPPTMEREKAVSEEIGTGRIKQLEGTIEVVVNKEEKEPSFWERIGRLPSLQRAIVLSEVLGPPKGIEKTD